MLDGCSLGLSLFMSSVCGLDDWMRSSVVVGSLVGMVDGFTECLVEGLKDGLVGEKVWVGLGDLVGIGCPVGLVGGMLLSDGESNDIITGPSASEAGLLGLKGLSGLRGLFGLRGFRGS